MSSSLLAPQAASAPDACDPDAAFVEQWLEGRSAAVRMRGFGKLVERHHATVYARLCRRYFPADADAAADVTQQIFETIYRKRGFRREANFHAYLNTVARNTALNALRGEKRRRARVEPVEDLDAARAAMAAPHAAAVGASPASSPEALLGKRREAARVHAAIRALPPQYGELLCMFYLEQFNYEELARELNLKLGTVKSRLNRARDLLRAQLTASGTHSEESRA